MQNNASQAAVAPTWHPLIKFERAENTKSANWDYDYYLQRSGVKTGASGVDRWRQMDSSANGMSCSNPPILFATNLRFIYLLNILEYH